MVKTGIIGMGIRGQMYAESIEQNNQASVEAITEVNNESLEKNKEKFNTKGYKDYKKMIDENDLDAIIVATPDHLHKEPVIYAAERGLHLLIEKPFSNSVSDAEEMHNVISKNKIKCLVAFENRWNPPFVAVKKEIESGNIGEINSINSRLNDTIFVPTEMLKWSKNSTPGWFLFPHIIDMACWYNNKDVKKVYAVGTKKKLISLGIDTYDSMQATVTFDDGTNAVFTTSWILPESMPLIYDCKFEIIGEEGALYIDLQDQMVKHAGKSYKHLSTIGTSINGELTLPPTYMLNSFVDSIVNNTAISADSEAGLKNTKIVEGVHRSIKENKAITID
ncbi:putative dehydrogenase [Halanaerobium congolense]|uniref:Putative dehydrogenase n=1 Tax=Halanaerobium congolense TaxID=54121 RepID=A0A4R8GFI7_9FIRM|nr:Gfo/Idh/MocA family oxidoreductase [Halanaerobium congolense]TDX42948.1 putative dehydrogenase [Halanaerobium congolense]